MRNSLQLTILSVIAAAAKPIKSDAIRANPACADLEAKQVSQALWTLKDGGLVVADEARAYSVTAKGKAAIATADDDPKIDEGGGSRKTKQRGRLPAPTIAAPKPDLTTSGVVESVLAELAADAQKALDTYLCSVGERAIYEPLQRARDDSRRALEQHQLSRHGFAKANKAA